MRVQRQVTYHDYEGIALDMDERTRMAKDLGAKSRAMILRNHGLLTLGETVREAFELMYYLDCACQIQIDAMAGGLENVLQMSRSAADTASEQFDRPERPSTHKDWPALLRLLERRGINYLD
jgi:ribulose-5-phosphate 4-epimerase/fuculose-1-phosphate aldolase